METGRLFLMPNKNSTIQHSSSSIHLFVNGFSFCTPSKTEFVPLTENIEDFKSTLKDLLLFYPKSTFTQTQIVCYHQPSTFVPKAFFDKKLLSNYVKFLGTLDAHSALNYDELEEEKQVNVYSYPKTILEILNQNLENATFCHYNSLLYREVTSLAASSNKKQHLFVHLQKGAMDLYLCENSTVIFQNHFSIQNEDEFLYYVFFVVEQYKLSTADFEIVFLGKITAFESYYRGINEYHDFIRFETSKTSSLLIMDQHPAPFFAQLFS